jgi:hypothetical protein
VFLPLEDARGGRVYMPGEAIAQISKSRRMNGAPVVPDWFQLARRDEEEREADSAGEMLFYLRIDGGPPLFV